ncbi:MAG: radical SAM family heme chaperone HemW [Ruminococcus sp.]|jgi:oxygen-independent coproporphyrinogen-3 oxidase|nr:radical SAM family heme chaperone HemW [Ruminococcus sp.]
MSKPQKPIGLYIHVPFCKRKCRYCDFYSVTRTDLTEDYVKAAIRNIKTYGDIIFDTVYFGGGTPSLLSPNQIGEILRCADLAADCEITLECNPNSAAEEIFKSFAETGINRISIGVQSLCDETLLTLGRLHNAETAVKTLMAAVKIFKNVSADLMIGLPGQTVYDIQTSIKTFAEIGLNHISIYMLKIEADTPFYKNPPEDLPDEDRVAELYLETVKTAEENGFCQYEISNFAKPGYESKHNTKYWECNEYIGIGPSAHSYYGGKRFAVKRDLGDFLNAPVQNTYITDENPGSADERIMLNLRLTQTGIKTAPALTEKILPFIKAGFLKTDNERLTLTPQGCLVSNPIIGEIISIFEKSNFDNL